MIWWQASLRSWVDVELGLRFSRSFRVSAGNPLLARTEEPSIVSIRSLCAFPEITRR